MMKKIVLLILALTLIFGSALTLSSCGSDEKIYVQTNAYFAPFEYYDGSEIVGVDVEIMELVGKRLGKEIVWSDGDFGIIIDIVQKGEYADCGAAGLTITEQRAAKVDFSTPYYTSAQYVVVVDGFEITTSSGENGEYVVWEALSGMTVATQTDTTGWIYADAEIDCEGGVLYGSEATEHKAMDSINVASDALGKTIDAIIVDELPAKYITGNNGGFTCYPLYYKGEDGEADSPVEEQYAIAVTKGNTELLNAINEVLSELLVEDEEGSTEIEKMVMAHMGIGDEAEYNLLEGILALFSSEKYLNMLLEGLGTTLLISFFAALIGLVLGTVVAIVGISESTPLMRIPKAICKVYVAIIRGTPMALQLFVMAYAVFAIRGFPLEITAIIAFGINSGAYVSESIRAGILSVDRGQTEAGLALGLSKATTMVRIVIPQAIKNVIPAIGNELIALIKETSIVSMVGMYDLTQAAKVIGSGPNMASYIIPMTVVAAFYLAIVYTLTFGIKMIERRLRAGDKR